MRVLRLPKLGRAELWVLITIRYNWIQYRITHLISNINFVNIYLFPLLQQTLPLEPQWFDRGLSNPQAGPSGMVSINYYYNWILYRIISLIFNGNCIDIYLSPHFQQAPLLPSAPPSESFIPLVTEQDEALTNPQPGPSRMVSNHRFDQDVTN